MARPGLAKLCWGVVGLEPPEALPGGTTGDWEPEERICPLVAKGEARPRPRASITSRNLSGEKT